MGPSVAAATDDNGGGGYAPPPVPVPVLPVTVAVRGHRGTPRQKPQPQPPDGVRKQHRDDWVPLKVVAVATASAVAVVSPPRRQSGPAVRLYKTSGRVPASPPDGDDGDDGIIFLIPSAMMSTLPPPPDPDPAATMSPLHR